MYGMSEGEIIGVRAVIEDGKGGDYTHRVRKNRDSICAAESAVMRVRRLVPGCMAVDVSPYVQRALNTLSAESARMAAAA